MPKRLPTPKHAPAIPLSGSAGYSFPVASSLPVPARVDAQDRAAAQAREERVTYYIFLAYMVLTLLGVAAMGYALLAM